MSKSTTLNQLRKEQDNSELVQNILETMEEHPDISGGGSPQNMDAMPSQQGQQQNDQDYVEEYDDYYDEPLIQQKELSTTDMIISEAKMPLLVMLLVFLTNFSSLNQILVKNVPKLANADGDLNMIGLVAKVLLAGLVFYIVKRFLL